jgi:hypothetical protein
MSPRVKTHEEPRLRGHLRPAGAEALRADAPLLMLQAPLDDHPVHQGARRLVRHAVAFLCRDGGQITGARTQITAPEQTRKLTRVRAQDRR